MRLCVDRWGDRWIRLCAIAALSWSASLPAEGQDRDFGDAPESYRTSFTNSGPYHDYLADSHLGLTWDAETNGFPSVDGLGDDQDGSDDEDGVTFETLLYPGQPARVYVRIGDNDGYLSAWIDFNGDGDWSSDFGEKIVAGRYLYPRNHPLEPVNNRIIFNVPTNAVASSNMFARFRFTDSYQGFNGISAVGGQTSGEVEDHLVALATTSPSFDYGDAPDSYGTSSSVNGPHHILVSGVYLGRTVDGESDARPDLNAAGDDAGFSDDEDGVHFLSPFIPGTTATVEVVASTGGYLNAWIDWDLDGEWSAEDIPTQKVFKSQWISQGTNVLQIPVPTGAVEDVATYSRFRFSTHPSVDVSGRNATGVAEDGEVEDYVIYVGATQLFDFGDAPEPAYGTTSAREGARHMVNTQWYMGFLIDEEADGLPGALVTGDDLDNLDDEDGVTFVGAMELGSPETMRVTVSTAGYVNAWIDFDADLTWTGFSSEHVIVEHAVTTGVNNIPFEISACAVTTTPAKVRVRFTRQSSVIAPSGLAIDGEVEDYLAPPFVVPADTDADGMPDFWESRYFGSHTGASPYVDSDDDLMWNLEEFYGDTDPTNDASLLHIYDTAVSSGPTISVTTSIDRLYAVEIRTNGAPGNWHTAGDFRGSDSEYVWTSSELSSAVWIRVRSTLCYE